VTAFQGLIILALYFKCGDLDQVGDIKGVQKVMANFLGLSLLLSNNMIFPALFAVILQMPMQVPVFKRELMNKMYHPLIYYFARITSGTLVQMLQPIIMTFVVFFGLGIEINFVQFLQFLSYCMSLTLCGCSLGYFAGITFEEDTTARLFSQMIVMIFMLTSGVLANSTTLIPVIAQIQYISPVRYACEGFFRTFMHGKLPDFYAD
jgi:ABC-type polysaccharide/polyol phosphate export permease